MISKRVLEIIFCLFLIGVGIWITSDSYRLTIGRLREPGPGFFPFFAGILVALLSSVKLVHLVLQSKRAERAFSSYRDLMRIIYVLFGAVLAMAFFERFGYFIVASLYLILLMKVVSQEKWLRTFTVTAFTMFFSYLVFVLILRIQLPISPF